MKSKECAAGYLRINQLMIEMIASVEEGDKQRLIRLSQNFIEDTQDMVGLLITAAGITDAELESLTPSGEEDEELVRDAASASVIRTASVR